MLTRLNTVAIPMEKLRAVCVSRSGVYCRMAFPLPKRQIRN
jgi:hypothetical protein